MSELARRAGLGLASQGDIDEIVDWVRLARDSGLDSVWFHESYFQRDAVTYATAIATALAGDRDSPFRVALAALNPNTRHPVVLAMTGSALDEILPERIVMGLGTALPLRLAQMGIPYSVDEAVERVSVTMDQLRALWAGERIPAATPGLPAIQPMFPPAHRIPIFVAGYRKELVELAGRKADGYVGRPCESIPSLRGILERLRASAAAAGRDPDSIETASYLLSLVDGTRREALNRAKRDPFVIYMMSILGDVSLARAGFERDLRDRIAAAWKAEDYHEAGKLIPDDLLDAFMLCGTREDVAERALAFHLETGLDVPLLQPVVQEAAQAAELIEAARLYAQAPGRAPATAGVEAATAGGRAVSEAGPRASLAVDDRRLGRLERLRRRAAAAWEIVRPFAFTVTLIPILSAAALAYVDSRLSWLPFVAALASALLLQAAANVINELYDVRQGIDTILSPRASQAIVKGRLSEGAAQALAIALFVAASLIGLYLVALRGPVLAGLGLFGIVAGYTYTAPPFHLKYHALGVPLIVATFGPIMVVGAYFAIAGTFDPRTVVVSLPAGLFVGAVVQGNEWRDIGDDARAGILTLSIKLGRRFAHYLYLGFVMGAYLSLGLAVALGWLPPTTAIALFSLPLLAQAVLSAELGAAGQARAIAMIDLQTARLYLTFGTLLVLGLLLSRTLPG
jgi:1,4-dihydroxy-2-naphthoate octaprenyltransferase/alkanesulfonate monooxygenase SsuD/methylene tetrahydromethanopterin reductase-like flavin-dependent oxidoreductase (luciferase family)